MLKLGRESRLENIMSTTSEREDEDVGKSVAWKADGRGFESHPRQLIFL